MRIASLSVAVLVALCLNTACEDDGGAGGDPSGGGEANAGGDGSGATGATGAVGGAEATSGGDGSGAVGGGENASCGAGAETLVADVGAPTLVLAVSETSIAYVTRLDAAAPTDLSVMALDGSDQAVIYTSEAGSAVESIAWGDEEVLFLEAVDGTAESLLFRIPAAGGDKEQVGTETFVDGRLLGADADAVYVYADTPTSAILRVSLTDGGVETVGNMPGNGGILHTSLAGDELFFLGTPDSGPGLQTVFRLPASATDAEPEVVFDALENPGCGFPQGGLVATPTRLVCGYMHVAAFSREDGTPEGTIIDGVLTEPPANIVVASSEESIYVIQLNDGTFDGQLRRANSDGSDDTAIVCDLGQVSTQIVDGFFPLSDHYQIAVGGGRIVWIEERRPEAGDAATISIRSAPL